MKTIAMALGSITTCGLCQVLMANGGTTPKAIREFNEMRERNGYRGAPVFGIAWMQLLVDHEADHLKRGEKLPNEWTVRGIPKEFYDVLEAPKAKPVAKPIVRKPAPRLDDATKEFLAYARPVVHQRNGRMDNRPVVKPLDTTPFKGL
jgi:hypothetical protein